MAKHKLTTFRQTDLAMHEYISKFTDLVEHAYTLTPTDPASTILATNTEGIKNPHIKNKDPITFQIYMTFLDLH